MTRDLHTILEARGNDDELARAIADGADVNHVVNGFSPLHLAAALLDVGYVRALLDAGADPSPERPNGDRPMQHAFVRDESLSGDALTKELADCAAIVDLLMAHGAALRSERDRPVAHSVLVPDMIPLLIERGAEVDARDAHGNTPLHRAVRMNRANLVHTLIAHGADAQATNDSGQTPRAVAQLQLANPLNERAREATQEIDWALEAAGAPLPTPLDLLDRGLVDALVPDGGFGVQLRAILTGTYYQPSDLAERLGEQLGYYEHTLPALKVLTQVLRATPAARTRSPEELVDQPVLHHGDLTVTGDLQVTRALVVTGDLTVQGDLRDQRLTRSLVLVGGDVRCASLATHSEFHVAGTIEARDLIRGVGNDHVLCATALIAPLVIHSDHQCEGEVRAEREIDTHEQDPAEVFVPEVLSDDGYLVTARVLEVLRAGGAVLRG